MAGDQDTTVKITGDASGLVNATDQGAQGLNKLGTEAQKINAQGPLDKINQGANKAIGPVAGLVGRLGSLAGMYGIVVSGVALAVAGINKFANAADIAREKAKASADATAQFVKELKNLSTVNTASDSPEKQAVDLAKRLEELDGKYKKLRLELSANAEISGGDRQRLNVELRRQEAEEFNNLNRAVESNNRLLTARDEGNKQAAQRKALREALEAEKQLREQVEDERTDDIGRLANERARKVAEIEDRLAGEQDEAIQAAYRRQIQLTNDLYAAKTRTAQEAINKEAQAERQRIEETNRREQDSIRQIAAAQAAFSQAQDATYQSNSLDLLQQIAQGISAINGRQ